jgi:hypothetical protein
MGKIIKKNANYKSVGKNGKTSDNKTFDDLIKEKRAFVKFHSTGCGHCANMADAWKELGAHDFGIYIIEVDVDGISAIQSKCKEGSNKGVPYMAMVNKDGTVYKEYTEDRSVETMKKFITDNKISQPSLLKHGGGGTFNRRKTIHKNKSRKQGKGKRSTTIKKRAKKANGKRTNGKRTNGKRTNGKRNRKLK